MMSKITVMQALELGINAHKQRDFKLAISYFDLILRSIPDHPDANHNLGVVYRDMGSYQQALRKFEKAASLKPDFEQFWFSWLNLLIELKRLGEAKIVLKKAISSGISDIATKKFRSLLYSPLSAVTVEQLRADDVSRADLKMLNDLYGAGSYSEVISLAYNLVQKYTQSVPLHKMLGDAYGKLNQYLLALEHYDSALIHSPNDIKILLAKIAIVNKLNRTDDALKCCESLIKLVPNKALPHILIAQTYVKLDDFNKALKHFRLAKSVEAEDHHVIYEELGKLYSRFGKQSDAIKNFRRAIDLRPEYAKAYYGLVNTRACDDNLLISEMLALDANNGIEDADKIHLKFALAVALDRTKRYDEAFKYYLQANKLRFEELNYDISEHVNLFLDIKKLNKVVKKFPMKIQHKPDDKKPIFIVGMPRSGTSLLHQIISNHSNVHGAGELPDIGALASKIIRSKQVSESTLLGLRNSYLEKLAHISPDKEYVVDKMPDNFKYINFIIRCFPEANVIYIKRSPQSVIWSNFKVMFATDGHAYNHDLGTLKKYYGLHVNLMKFWRLNYPGRVIEVSYDDIVNHPNDTVPPLISNLGLPWEENCLRPEKNKSIIATASIQQVREGIYKGSSEDWLNFKPYLRGELDDLKLS